MRPNLQTQIMRHRDFYPVSLNGCILYLPFWIQKEGIANRILDLSGNNNHGTINGAVPAQTPMLSGIELVSNGGMEAGNPPTGWSALGTPEIFERSGVQEYGGYYSAHILDSTASLGGFKSSATLISGRRYKLSFWYYIQSGVLRAYSDGSPDIFNQTYATTGLWLYAEIVGINTDSTYIAFANNSALNAAEFYIDNASLQEVLGYEGLGWGFDGLNDKVVVADSPSLDIGGSDFTIMFWARTYGQLGSRYISKRDNVVLNKGYEVMVWGVKLPAGTGSGLGIGMFIGDLPHGNTSSHLSSVATIIPDRWQHIAVTFDRDDVATGYVNCVPGDSPRDISGFSGTIANTADLIIGKNASLDQQFLNGTVGDVLIVNRLLSTQEIRNHYELTRHRFLG